MQIADLKKKFKERRPIDELKGLIIKEEDSLINSEERNQKKNQNLAMNRMRISKIYLYKIL